MLNVSGDPGAPPSAAITVNATFGSPFTVPYPVSTARVPDMLNNLNDVAFKDTLEA